MREGVATSARGEGENGGERSVAREVPFDLEHPGGELAEREECALRKIEVTGVATRACASMYLSAEV